MTLEELRTRIASLPSPRSAGIPDDLTPASGQLWKLRDCDPEQSPWVALIYRREDDLLQVFPAFRWGELAGPNDIIVSQSLAGTRMVVSLEPATIDASALLDCTGSLPGNAMTYILDANANRNDPVRRLAWEFGLPYIDAHDHRLAYHVQINDQLEDLQESVRRALYDSPEPLAFPALHDLFAGFPVLAAASDDTPPHTQCVILRGAERTQVWGEALDFERPVRTGRVAVDWEWWLDPPLAGSCEVYCGSQCIGTAEVTACSSGTHIRLQTAELPEDSDIAGPEDVRLIIVVQL